MHLLAPFTDQNDRFSYPFIYFNQWIPHTFIYLRPEKGTPSGWSLHVHYRERPYRGWGAHVARLNFKTSHVGVYKCVSFIVGFAVTVAIWLREVVSCRDFILRAVLGHVAGRNLPWQGPWGILPIWAVEPDRYSALKSRLTNAALSSIECDN